MNSSLVTREQAMIQECYKKGTLLAKAQQEPEPGFKNMVMADVEEFLEEFVIPLLRSQDSEFAAYEEKESNGTT